MSGGTLSRLFTVVRPAVTRSACQLTPTGIAVDLQVVRFAAVNVLVEIAFSDIEEIRAMTYIEAACDREIGRNVVVGSIARPSVVHAIHSLGRTLLIRALDLFYAITVDRASAEAVMNAYTAFTLNAPRPVRVVAAPPSPSRRSGASGR